MRLKFSLIYLLGALFVLGCAGKRELTMEDPYSQASVVIHLKDGSKREGIVLKRDGNKLVYIDASDNKRSFVLYENIQSLDESDKVYDFEAVPIPHYQINDASGLNNTLLYGAGGLVMGAAAGTAVGVALVGAGVDAPPLISTAVFGIAGAWYFGRIGLERDFEDAAFEVRKQRAEEAKVRREKLLEEEKRKLEEQQRQKEELQKEIDKKKKKDG